MVGTAHAEQHSPMGGHTGGTKCLLEATAGLRLGGESVWVVKGRGGAATLISSLSCVTQRELTLTENVPLTITRHHRVAKYPLISPSPSLQALAIF